jgi:CheY-like chemotaxis protein
MREFIKAAITESFPSVEIYDASNGKEAQQKLEAARFDVVLCDWEMPEMSGSDLLKWVRSTPAFKDIPFIMVTAKREKESILDAINAGVTDYIVKPLNAEVLCQKLTAVLRKLDQKSQ